MNASSHTDIDNGGALAQRLAESSGQAMSNLEMVLSVQPPPEVDHVRFFANDDVFAATFDIFAALFHPDFVSSGMLLGSEMTCVGAEGCRTLLRHWYEPWDTYRIESREAIALGQQVLVTHEAFGRLAGSQAEVKLTGAALYTLRAGKIAGIVFYIDRDEALKAVGLQQ